MDRQISVRFYDVSKQSQHGPSLRSVLKEIHELGGPERRERTISEDFRVRLECLEASENHIAGEFTRVQDSNFPSEVHADGVARLNVEVPLGHGIAFRFRPAGSIIAVQYEPRVLSPNRITSYLQLASTDAIFKLRPRMNADSWQRMRKRPLRKLKFRIARPSNLANIENTKSAVASSIRNMAAAYEAPSIAVELSMGNYKGGLGKATKAMAEEIYKLFQEEKLDVRSLQAISETPPGIANEDINLIDEVLSFRGELKLPKNDPDKNYRMRADWLKEQMQKHV